jgi:hypothetical protein
MANRAARRVASEEGGEEGSGAMTIVDRRGYDEGGRLMAKKRLPRREEVRSKR